MKGSIVIRKVVRKNDMYALHGVIVYRSTSIITKTTLSKIEYEM